MKLSILKNATLLLCSFALLQQASAQVIANPAIYSPVAGGARILAVQGETAANPAIGFTGGGAVPGNLNDGGGGNGIYRPAANTMAFATGSAPRMFIGSGGNVGIGTGDVTPPSQRLQVSGGNLLLDYSTGGGVGNLFFGGLTTSSQNGLRLSFYNSAGGGFKNGFIDVRTTGGTAQDGLIFRVDGTIGGTERMRICANGNVGINTTAPAAKLHLSTASQNDGIRVSQTGTTAATLSLIATGTGAKNWAFHSTGPGNAQGAGHLLFWDWTANLERMRIDNAGNVGIGLTTNPGTYRLYVGGNGYYSGGLFVASDRRFKTNIRTLDGALNTVTRLRGVQYQYRQNEFTERNFPGGQTDGYVAYPIALLVKKPDRDALEQMAESETLIRQSPAAGPYLAAIDRSDHIRLLAAVELALEWTDVKLVSDDPAKVLGKARKRELVAQRLGEVLGAPNNALLLISPYFVPTASGAVALTGQAACGVAVSVLTNSLAATDVPIVHAGYAKRRRALLRGGVRLFELKPDGIAAHSSRTGLRRLTGSSSASLHAKTIAVDGERVFIGSFNLDPRSAALNTESGFVIESRRMASEIAAAFEKNLATQSYALRLDDDGRIEWQERATPDGPARVHRQEPQTPAWKRAFVWLVSWLPIEWLL